MKINIDNEQIALLCRALQEKTLFKGKRVASGIKTTISKTQSLWEFELWPAVDDLEKLPARYFVSYIEEHAPL